MRLPKSSILRRKKSVPKQSIIPKTKKNFSKQVSIVQRVNVQNAYGTYLKSLIKSSEIVTTMLDNLLKNKAYLAIGHGDLGPHMNNSSMFTVPSNKYIIFLSNPGVQITSSWIFDPVFESKDSIAKLISGDLKRKKGPLGDAYKRRYIPGMKCPNLSINFFDLHNPQIHETLGVWTLPLKSNPSNTTRPFIPPTDTTLKHIIEQGPDGVYIILSCRRTDTNQIDTSLNLLQNLFRRKMRRNLTIDQFKNLNFVRAQGSLSNDQLIREYAHFLLMRLQNAGVVGTGPTSMRIQNYEAGAFRITSLKRKRKPSPTQQPQTKRRKTIPKNINTLTKNFSKL